MRRFGRTIGALCLMASAGCLDTTAPDHALDAARNRWAQNGPASYDITVSRFCECTAESAAPVIVAVRNGVVQSRRYVQTGAEVSPSVADAFPTVEGLFDVIEQALRERAVMLSVRYDPIDGHPISISIDRDAVTADDEVVYTVADFVAR